MSSQNEWESIKDTVLLVLYIIAFPFIFIFSLFAGAYSLALSFRNTPERLEKEASVLTNQLYKKALVRFPRDREGFVDSIAEKVCHLSDEVAYTCVSVAIEIWEMEDFDIPPPPAVANSIEGARYRDFLSNLTDVSSSIYQLNKIFNSFISHIPAESEGISFAMRIEPTGKILEDITLPLYTNDYEFGRLRVALDRNLCRMSNLPATPEHYESPKLLMPSKYTGKEPLINYVKGTPLQRLFSLSAPLSIPKRMLFEHLHIMGSTGSGKTQLLQYLICQLLETDSSIVIMDSQGGLLNNVQNLKAIEKERIVILDPTDPEHVLALNLFDIGQERLKHFSKRDYEQHMNGAVDLISYVLSSILDAEVTKKQSAPLKYIIRLLVLIPDATLLTLRDILKPDGLDPYLEHIPKLSDSAQMFFEHEFNTKGYAETKKQILWRLYTLLESPAIERIFSSKKSRFSMKDAMDNGKVVLVHTNKDFLRKEGCEFFGKFFVSLIAQATQERINQKYCHPTFVIIDEAQEYIDENLSVLYTQARKYFVGITIAHQHLSQLTPEIRDSVITNSNTRFLSGASKNDASTLADDMRTNTEFIMSQKKLSFAMYSQGTTKSAVSINVPAGYMENMPTRSIKELAEINVSNQDKYYIDGDYSDDIRPKTPVDVKKTEINEEKSGIPDDPLAPYT